MTKRVVVIIPARGGSKGVPGKNLAPLGGYPLLAYTVAAARLAKTIDRVIVSTDADDIAAVGAAFGAEVPFRRPAAISGDASTDLEFVRHALDWLAKNDGGEPALLVHLRPTTPLRDPALIDDAVRLIQNRPEATGLRSVHEIRESPYKLFGREGDYLVGLFPNDPRPEYYNLPRQAFPPVYQPNGYVDAIRPSTVAAGGSLHGPRILGFTTPDVGEVDRPEDLELIGFRLDSHGRKLREHLAREFPRAVRGESHVGR